MGWFARPLLSWLGSRSDCASARDCRPVSTRPNEQPSDLADVCFYRLYYLVNVARQDRTPQDLQETRQKGQQRRRLHLAPPMHCIGFLGGTEFKSVPEQPAAESILSNQ